MDNEDFITRLKSAFRFISDLAAFGAALLGILAVVTGGAIGAFFSRQQNLAAILIGSVVGTVTTALLGSAMYLWAASSSTTKWLLRGYRLLEADYLYEIHTAARDHESQTVTIHLKTTHFGVEIYESRYSWTGNGREGKPQILSENAGHRLIGEIGKDRVGNSKYFYIHLGRKLPAKSVVQVITCQHFYASQNSLAESRLSKTIVEPLGKLRLRVRMPRVLYPINIFCTEWSSSLPYDARIISQTPYLYEPKNQVIEIEWQPKKLRRGHMYEITWDYAPQSEGQPVPLQTFQQPPQQPPSLPDWS